MMNDSMSEAVNILVECPELIASVRVGVLEPLSPLVKEGRCNVVFKKTKDIKKDDIKWCDILVIVRGFEHITLEIVKSARKAGRFIIYFLDDDLLHLPEDVTGGKWFQNPEVRQTMINIINNSDRLWCVNPLIGEKYKVYCDGAYILGKVPVDISDVDKSKTSDVIRVLYAGASDHSKLLQKYISPAVISICREYGDKVEFTFIGANPDIKDIDNVKYIDYIRDYDEYKKLVSMGAYDIGLAIVAENEFYKAKYYNKFIEYTSVGAVGIYTNNKPYTIVVKDRVNGFLCDNQSWYETLKEVIDNDKLRIMCYENAHKLLEEKYNYAVVGKDMEILIPELITYHADKSIKVIFRNSRFSFYKRRILTIWQEHRILFLKIIFEKIIKKIIKRE